MAVGEYVGKEAVLHDQVWAPGGLVATAWVALAEAVLQLGGRSAMSVVFWAGNRVQVGVVRISAIVDVSQRIPNALGECE